MNDLRRLRDNLDRWGGDLGRWPAAERSWGERVLTRSPEAAAMLRAERDFDRELMAAAPEARTRHMRNAIMDALPPSHSQLVSAPRWWASWFGWAGGLGAAAASVALSFYIGTASPGVWPGHDDVEAGYATSDVDGILVGIGPLGDGL